jgi:hypothetical protein
METVGRLTQRDFAQLLHPQSIARFPFVVFSVVEFTAQRHPHNSNGHATRLTACRHTATGQQVVLVEGTAERKN